MIEVEFIRSDKSIVVTVDMPTAPLVGEEVTFKGIVYIVVSREWTIVTALVPRASAIVQLRGRYKRAKNRATGEMVDFERTDKGVRFRWPEKDGTQEVNPVSKFIDLYEMVIGTAGVVE